MQLWDKLLSCMWLPKRTNEIFDIANKTEKGEKKLQVSNISSRKPKKLIRETTAAEIRRNTAESEIGANLQKTQNLQKLKTLLFVCNSKWIVYMSRKNMVTDSFGFWRRILWQKKNFTVHVKYSWKYSFDLCFVRKTIQLKKLSFWKDHLLFFVESFVTKTELKSSIELPNLFSFYLLAANPIQY